MNAAALILAGGKATRMGGVAKHALIVEGETILARQARILAPRVDEIIVSCNQPVEGFRTVEDFVANAGPLAGIAAGLSATSAEWLLVVAGDMPDLSGAVVELLLSETDQDATGLRVDDLPQPLLCVLRVAVFRPLVAARLAAGDFKASRLLASHPRVRWLDPRTVDPQLSSLRNVNTVDDL